jgi:hypothetical protein
VDSDTLVFAHVMTVIILSVAGFVAVGLGARILWRLGSRAPQKAAPSTDRRDLQRLETAVESIAIEVERISESQRFMVSLLSSRLPGQAGNDAKELPAPEPVKRAITPR